MTTRREEFEIALEAGLDEVWTMLTTGRGLSAWFGVDAQVDLRPGGRVRVSWGEEVVETSIADLEDRRRLRVVYDTGPGAGAEEWLLEHDDGVTRLRLVHTLPDPGVEDWDDWYGDFRRGWRLFLASLRWALEDAPSPWRQAACRRLPVATRRRGWSLVCRRLGLPEDPTVGDPVGAVGRIRLVDPPHSLLVAGDTRTLLCDLEGDGDALVVYVQAAVHGDDDPSWRAAVLDRVAPEAAPDENARSAAP